MHHICIKYRANWKMPRYSLFWCNRQENNELSQWGIPKTPHLYLTYISLDTSLLSWWNKWGLSEVYQTHLTRLYRPIHRGRSLIKWVSEVKSVKVWIKKNSSNIISSDEFINIYFTSFATLRSRRCGVFLLRRGRFSFRRCRLPWARWVCGL